MSTDNGIRWIPWMLIGIAVVAAWVFSNTGVEDMKRYAAGIFGVSLGSSLLLWGLEELRNGRIRGKRVQVHRDNSPVEFFLLIAGMRFLPGLAMLLGAIWYLFRRQA